MKLSETFNVGDIFQDNDDDRNHIRNYNRIVNIINNEFINIERVKIDREIMEVMLYNTFTINSKISNLNRIIEDLGFKVKKIPDKIIIKDITLYTNKCIVDSLVSKESRSLLTNISLNKEDLGDESEPIEIQVNNFEQKYIFNWDKIEFEKEEKEEDFSDQFNC
jgi:hypothetical protein